MKCSVPVTGIDTIDELISKSKSDRNQASKLKRKKGSEYQNHNPIRRMPFRFR